MRLDFLVPGLLGSPVAQRIREFAPALATLLARASVVSEPAESMEMWITRRFQLTAEGKRCPFAAIASLAERIAHSNAKYWLRADPVHLSVNRDRVVLLDASQLDITPAESTALVATLQAHFRGDDLTFIGPHVERWYVTSDKAIGIRTHPVSTVRGRNVADYWFDGTDRALWQTRLSEMQMLLHAHPVNEAREAAGQLAINGVWFWGEGEMPSTFKHHYAQIIARDVLFEGIAALSSAQFVDASRFHWSELTSELKDSILVVLDQLDVSAAYGEWEAWQTSLSALDQNWFTPALALLQKGHLKTINICAPSEKNGKTFSTSRIDQLKFWRRSHIT